MEVGRDSLGELVQLGQQQQIPQLRLTDKYKLQDLKFIRVDVGQHPQMLKCFRFEILRLVNDQDRAPAGRVPGFRQPGVTRRRLVHGIRIRAVIPVPRYM